MLPPNFFVIATGRILSSIDTSTAKTPEIIRPVIEISQYSEKKAASKPPHARGAPGRTGTKVPINPTKRRTPAKIAALRGKKVEEI